MGPVNSARVIRFSGAVWAVYRQQTPGDAYSSEYDVKNASLSIFLTKKGNSYWSSQKVASFSFFISATRRRQCVTQTFNPVNHVIFHQNTVQRVQRVNLKFPDTSFDLLIVTLVSAHNTKPAKESVGKEKTLILHKVIQVNVIKTTQK